MTKTQPPLLFFTKRRILFSFLGCIFLIFVAITFLLQSHARRITEIRVSARRWYFQGKNSDLVRHSSLIGASKKAGQSKEEIYAYLKKDSRRYFVTPEQESSSQDRAQGVKIIKNTSKFGFQQQKKEALFQKIFVTLQNNNNNNNNDFEPDDEEIIKELPGGMANIHRHYHNDRKKLLKGTVTAAPSSSKETNPVAAPLEVIMSPVVDHDEYDPLLPNASMKGTIPRNVYTIWKTDKLPEPMANIDLEWSFAEPNYGRRTVPDHECRELALLYDYKLLEHYDLLPLNVMRADVCKILILYFYGGIYMDLDVKSGLPLDEWLDLNVDIILGWENEDAKMYANWFMASKPRHHCLNHTLWWFTQELNSYHRYKVDFRVNEHAVGLSTGAGALYRAMSSCVKPILSAEDVGSWKLVHTGGGEFTKPNINSPSGEAVVPEYAHWVAERDVLRGLKKDVLPRTIWTFVPGNDPSAILDSVDASKFHHINSEWEQAESPMFDRRIVRSEECWRLAARFPNLISRFSAMSKFGLEHAVCSLLVVYYYGGIYMDPRLAKSETSSSSSSLRKFWPTDSPSLVLAGTTKIDEVEDANDDINDKLKNEKFRIRASWMLSAAPFNPCIAQVIEELISHFDVVCGISKSFLKKLHSHHVSQYDSNNKNNNNKNKDEQANEQSDYQDLLKAVSKNSPLDDDEETRHDLLTNLKNPGFTTIDDIFETIGGNCTLPSSPAFSLEDVAEQYLLHPGKASTLITVIPIFERNFVKYDPTVFKAAFARGVIEAEKEHQQHEGDRKLVAKEHQQNATSNSGEEPPFEIPSAELQRHTINGKELPVKHFGTTIFEVGFGLDFVSEKRILPTPHFLSADATTKESVRFVRLSYSECSRLAQKFAASSSKRSRFYEVYEGAPFNEMRKDFCRLLSLYFCGGIYIEEGFEFTVGSPTLWIQNHIQDSPFSGFVYGIDSKVEVTDNNTSIFLPFMASFKKRDPCLGFLIERMGQLVAKIPRVSAFDYRGVQETAKTYLETTSNVQIAKLLRLAAKKSLNAVNCPIPRIDVTKRREFLRVSKAFLKTRPRQGEDHNAPHVATHFYSPTFGQENVEIERKMRSPIAVSPGRSGVFASADEFHRYHNQPLNELIDVNTGLTNPFPVIPKEIHVVWKTEYLFDAASGIDTEWQVREPTYRRHVVTDADCLNFAKRFPNLYTRFLHLPMNVMRADICRVLAVYFLGGIYMDLDAAWAKPMVEWFDTKEPIVIGWEEEGLAQYCNWFFAATPFHPCFRQTLELMTEGLRCTTNESVYNMNERHWIVHETTGPIAFTRGLKQCLEKPLLNSRQVRSEYIDHKYASQTWTNNKNYESWTAERQKNLNCPDMWCEKHLIPWAGYFVDVLGETNVLHEILQGEQSVLEKARKLQLLKETKAAGSSNQEQGAEANNENSHLSIEQKQDLFATGPFWYYYFEDEKEDVCFRLSIPEVFMDRKNDLKFHQNSVMYPSSRIRADDSLMLQLQSIRQSENQRIAFQKSETNDVTSVQRRQIVDRFKNRKKKQDEYLPEDQKRKITEAHEQEQQEFEKLTSKEERIDFLNKKLQREEKDFFKFMRFRVMRAEECDDLFLHRKEQIFRPQLKDVWLRLKMYADVLKHNITRRSHFPENAIDDDFLLAKSYYSRYVEPTQNLLCRIAAGFYYGGVFLDPFSSKSAVHPLNQISPPPKPRSALGSSNQTQVLVQDTVKIHPKNPFGLWLEDIANFVAFKKENKDDKKFDEDDMFINRKFREDIFAATPGCRLLKLVLKKIARAEFIRQQKVIASFVNHQNTDDDNNEDGADVDKAAKRVSVTDGTKLSEMSNILYSKLHSPLQTKMKFNHQKGHLSLTGLEYTTVIRSEAHKLVELNEDIRMFLEETISGAGTREVTWLSEDAVHENLNL